MTTDHASLLNLLQNVRTDIAQRGLIEDGTAIGMGLANAVSRLKDSKAKSKVIILLTDGSNNRGDLSPMTAAEIAKSFGIRVYTIGVGKEGEAPYPVMTPWGPDVQNMKVEIDEPLLKQIAAETGGKYFRANDNTKLAEIYSEIDRMEKTRTTVDSFPIYKDLFPRFAIWALVCLLLEILIRFLLRRLP
jgi:Ca-activated chloride channel family protein